MTKANNGISISVTKINSLKPLDKPVEYFDERLTQLKLTVYPTGTKSWMVRYTQNGKKCSVSLGIYPDVSIEQAKSKANEILALVGQGIDPKAKTATRSTQQTNVVMNNTPTLNEFIPRYLSHVEITKKSWREDQAKLRDWLSPHYGDIPLDQISLEHTDGIRAIMLKQDLANATINRVTATLSAVLSLAVRWRIISANPLLGMKKLQEKQITEGTMTLSEAKSFLQTAKKDINPIAGDALRVLLLTGLRLTEVTHAKWNNFDAVNKILYLPETKSGKSRYVDLNEYAVAIIESQVRISEYIFYGKDKRKPINNLKKAMSRILKSAYITKHVRIHDLRHTFATLAINNGESLEVIQKMLGHSTMQMTTRYAKVSSTTIRKSSNNVAELMQA